MISLSTMTSAERAYMARRLPRTYRAMVLRAERGEVAPDTRLQQLFQRRSGLLAYQRHRHRTVKASRLSRMTGRQRNQPSAVSYFAQLRDRICHRLSAHTGYRWPELISQSRGQDLVRARQAGMYLLLKHTHMNLPQVGKLFGGRDHSTVVYARDKVAGNPGHYADILEPIEQQLGVH